MIQKTHKLYDADSYLFRFFATVLSCEKTDKGYAIILDRTAFFPEGGGQYADTGTLGGQGVLDVQIHNGIITHFVNSPLAPETTVEGLIDAPVRRGRMQLHTGEHILSGIANRRFGCDNVGFHLTDKWCTIDWNRVLTRDDLDAVEKEANLIISQNLPVRTWYPDAEEIRSISYRSKLELDDDIRIVEIPGVDCCACCAPHVSHTGEVGIIKILDFQHYKGGIRLYATAGRSSLEDYRERYLADLEVSNLLNAPQNELPLAVSRHLEIENELRKDIGALRLQIINLICEQKKAEPDNSPCLVVLLPFSDMNALRALVNKLMAIHHKPVCGLFTTGDETFSYILGAEGRPLSLMARTIHEKLGGRGGGSDAMIQGSFKASYENIKTVLNTVFA